MPVDLKMSAQNDEPRIDSHSDHFKRHLVGFPAPEREGNHEPEKSEDEYTRKIPPTSHASCYVSAQYGGQYESDSMVCVIQTGGGWPVGMR
jgi:hypothetical protein